MNFNVANHLMTLAWHVYVCTCMRACTFACLFSLFYWQQVNTYALNSGTEEGEIELNKEESRAKIIFFSLYFPSFGKKFNLL